MKHLLISCLRLFLVLIVFLFVFSSSSGQALAFSGSGAGTVGDPYQITTCDQLQEMNDELDANYILMDDIDCLATLGWNAGEGFVPVGSIAAFPTNTFSGTFDGQGFEISDLFINRANSYQALFGAIGSGAEISNVGLVDVDISAPDSFYIGALAGFSEGFIDNCFAVGTVAGEGRVGGLVGSNDGWSGTSATIQDSYAEVSVTASDGQAGGLVGNNIDPDNAMIIRSYATGDVVADNRVGGLVGVGGGIISDSYATGNVTGADEVGGLIGRTGGTITNSFATGLVTGDTNAGGLIGFVHAGGGGAQIFTNNFWDMETTGQATSGGGAGVVGKTTAEMNNISTFLSAGWDIAETETDLNDNYPFFAWQAGDDNPIWYIVSIALPESEPEPESQPQSQSSRSSGGGKPSAPSCADSAPTNSPDLFQIDVTNTKATLYFTPVTNANKYFVSFGHDENAEEHGVEFDYDDSSGVIAYTIDHLEQNSTYYVKIRGGNGCMTGDWSNTMQIKTRGTSQGGTSFYKNFASRILSIFPRQVTNVGSGNVSSNTAQVVSDNSCEHVVKPGDSLWKIASIKLLSGKKYNEIMNENNLSSTILSIGQRLQVGC